MGTITIDLPAWQAEDDWHAGVLTDALSEADTSTEVVMESSGFSLGIGYFAETAQAGGGYPNLVYMPTTPAGYTLTSATYVAIAYRETASTPSGSWSPFTPVPTTFPFLYADTSGTGDLYAFPSLPVGGYAGELVWAGTESLARLTAAPGSQHPANRLWVGDPNAHPPFIHVAYYAIRLTYTSADGLLPSFPMVYQPSPLRIHPRRDGRGTSTAPRIWPADRSIQASNRRAGGYL